VDRAVLTPDFHKGTGIPVGTVLETHGFVMPKCVGNDIACGMRLVSMGMTRSEFESMGSRVDGMLRHAFFEGGRDIPMSEAAREAMLRQGVPGLVAAVGSGGIWNQIVEATILSEMARTHLGGSWPTEDIWNFGDFVRGSGGVSRDSFIGTIGKGNHFVEFQWVDECLDRRSCYAWGLHSGTVAVMVHTGSVGIGGAVGSHFVEMARNAYPRELRGPEHGFYPLPTVGPQAGKGNAYLSAMGVAANFAVCNRLALAAMAVDCVSRCLGRRVESRLVYDAPHNLVWTDGDRHVHRKGACPAGCNHMDAEFSSGHPVLVPGSMGDASYVMRGLGSDESLCSAPHGAGRRVPRGQGRRSDRNEMQGIRVVTPIDIARTRRDVAEKCLQGLMEEAPGNYKSVMPAMETVSDACIAVPVARLMPIMTIKA
jgi:tRNA-splicing ligase RtcB